MRYLGFLFLLLLTVVVAWPYATLYRLSEALAVNDRSTLELLVDLESVRKIHKTRLQSGVDQVLGTHQNPVLDIVREGARRFGDESVEAGVDLAWVREKLTPSGNPNLFAEFSFAFFESPTRFQVRIGALGENPVHFYMTLQDWQWRVTAVYD